MVNKSKRKYDSNTLFKLKLLLLGFIIGTLVATFYPMIWLAPPLFALTPFVYIGFSLLWIPIAWKTFHRVTWDKVVRGLVIACISSTLLMCYIFSLGTLPNGNCKQANPKTPNEVYCYPKEINEQGCIDRRSFKGIQVGYIIIAQTLPWSGVKPFICILF